MLQSQIPDNIRLLGLIVKTKPFEYIDNVVMCEYESYIEINDLNNIKMQLENLLGDESMSDEYKFALRDDLDFITTTIQQIENKA